MVGVIVGGRRVQAAVGVVRDTTQSPLELLLVLELLQAHSRWYPAVLQAAKRNLFSNQVVAATSKSIGLSNVYLWLGNAKQNLDVRLFGSLEVELLQVAPTGPLVLV